MAETQGDRAEARRRAAERRHDELEALRLRLAAGEAISATDVQEATRRVAEAQQRAANAEASARRAHLEAATAHEHAATASEGAGHAQEAAQHRKAAALDLEAGGEQATAESRPTTGV